jgi:hypothetical protein
MNTMNLNAIPVAELSQDEAREIDGGITWKTVQAIATDIIDNWDAYVAEFKKGFAQGQQIR